MSRLYFWDDRLTASVNHMSNSISISNKTRAGDASERLYSPKIPRLRRTAPPSYRSISIRTHDLGYKTYVGSRADAGLVFLARALGCDLAGRLVTGCGVVTVKGNKLRARAWRQDAHFPVKTGGPDGSNEALEWLDRAEQAREVAGQLTDPGASRAVLQVADTFDRLARAAVARAAVRNPPSSCRHQRQLSRTTG